LFPEDVQFYSTGEKPTETVVRYWSQNKKPLSSRPADESGFYIFSNDFTGALHGVSPEYHI